MKILICAFSGFDTTTRISSKKQTNKHVNKIFLRPTHKSTGNYVVSLVASLLLNTS